MNQPRLFSLTARALLGLFAVTAVFAAAPQQAQAHRQVTLFEYDGGHPIPEPVEGWCDDGGIHVHSYALDPEFYPLYEVDGIIHFVGDPTMFGWGGDVNWYYDPHPIGHIADHWCVLEGPHSHLWGPVWSHRYYGRRYWSTYDRYYVYSGMYDGWFSWSWNLYHARVWGVHVRYVNRYRNVYYQRHPVYGYVDNVNRRPSWSGRHRHASNHDSARPRSGEDGRTGRSNQVRPRDNDSGPANGRATWDGGSSAGSAGDRSVSEDRRGYGDRDRDDRGAAARSAAEPDRSRSYDRSSRSYDAPSRADTSRTYGSSGSSSDRARSSRTYGSSGSSSSRSYDTPSRADTSRTYGDSRSSGSTTRSTRTYGSTGSSSSRSYDTPSRADTSRTYGSSGSSSSRSYNTPSRADTSRTYGSSGSSSSRGSSSRGSSSRGSSSRSYGTPSSSSSRSSGSASSSSSSSSGSSRSKSSSSKKSSGSRSSSSKSSGSRSSGSKSSSSRRR